MLVDPCRYFYSIPASSNAEIASFRDINTLVMISCSLSLAASDDIYTNFTNANRSYLYWFVTYFPSKYALVILEVVSALSTGRDALIMGLLLLARAVLSINETSADKVCPGTFALESKVMAKFLPSTLFTPASTKLRYGCAQEMNLDMYFGIY